MPVYDVQCLSCEREFETFALLKDVEEKYPHRIEGVHCPSCRGVCKVLITCTKNQDWFKPHWNPNFDIEPVYVRSRQHYKDLCRKYNVTSRAFGDTRNRKY